MGPFLRAKERSLGGGCVMASGSSLAVSTKG